jgi:hypothetical protein
MDEGYKTWIKQHYGIDMGGSFGGDYITEINTIASLMRNGQTKMAEHRVSNLYEAYREKNPDSTVEEMIEQLVLFTIKRQGKLESALSEESRISEKFQWDIIFNMNEVAG